MVSLTAIQVFEKSREFLGQTITITGQLTGRHGERHFEIAEPGRRDIRGILLKQPGLYRALCINVGMDPGQMHHITATGRLKPSEVSVYNIMLDELSYINIEFKGKQYVLDPQDIQRPAESELRLAGEHSLSGEERERFIRSLWELRGEW